MQERAELNEAHDLEQLTEDVHVDDWPGARAPESWIHLIILSLRSSRSGRRSFGLATLSRAGI